MNIRVIKVAFRKYILSGILLVSFAGLISCSDSSTSVDDTDTGNTEITASEEKQFVWNGLNAWYYWQGDVPDLADSKDDDAEAFSSFLNQFDTEEDLFDHLIYRQEDDFSWFIPDYEVRLAQRTGTSKSFGFRYQLVWLTEVGGRLFGYVQYVVPGSPADEAGLQRGDIFNRINGQELDGNNYLNLLDNETYEIGFAALDGDNLESLEESATMTAVTLQENPIHKVEVIETASAKVGYLMYNAFRFNFHDELNNAFGEFKSAGIDELVLDMRYNGGGALVTSAILAGLISGLTEDDPFASLIYNTRQSAQNQTFPFFDRLLVYDDSGEYLGDDTPMNQLSMNRLYVLATGRTASASETLINGLEPYGIEVIIIGEQTVGKDEGSITVYDAKDCGYAPSTTNLSECVNPNHKRAMQPIVFKIFNSNDEDYPDGFIPDIPARELDNVENLRPLGDPQELFLAAALEHIENGFVPAKYLAAEDERPYRAVEMKRSPVEEEFYLLPSDIERFRANKE
jgi:C-terminal processing protease CtpA/Prc